MAETKNNPPFFVRINISQEEIMRMLAHCIVAVSLLLILLFPLIVIQSEAGCKLPITYNEFGISSCENPPQIFLLDKNGKRVYADDVIFAAKEHGSNLSLVIPNEEYVLEMNVDNADHKKIFSMYYIVKVSDFISGYTSQIKWEQITIDPRMLSQEFEMPLQFEEGIYKIDVFLWHNLDNPKVVIASSHIENPIVKAITIDTVTRFVGESNNTILNSSQRFVDEDDIMITEVVMEPQGYLGGNWGGLEWKDKITLSVSSEKVVYGDISYFDVKKQEWLIVKQALSREFKISVQIPEKQSTFNFKWGIYVLNPNINQVRANITTTITNSP